MGRLKCGECINFQVDKNHECYGREEEVGEYGTCKIGTWKNDVDEAGCWSDFGCNHVKPKEEWRK